MPKKIDIFGPIGIFPNTKENIKEQLAAIGDEPVEVHISSFGGSLDDGIVIYNGLKAHKGKVTVIYDGLVASAATIIGSAGDERKIVENSFLRPHKVSSGIDILGAFNEEQIEALISDLKKIREDNKNMDAAIAGIYARETGTGIRDMVNTMQEDRWIPASETKDLGLSTEVIEATEKNTKVLAQMRAELKNHKELPVFPGASREGEKPDEDKIVNRVIDGLKNLFTNKASDPKNVEIKVTDEVSDFVKQAVADTLKETDQARDAEKKALNDKINILENEKALLQAKLDGRPPASGQGEDPDLEKGKRPKDPDQDFNDTVAKAWGWDEKVNNIKNK